MSPVNVKTSCEAITHDDGEENLLASEGVPAMHTSSDMEMLAGCGVGEWFSSGTQGS